MEEFFSSDDTRMEYYKKFGPATMRRHLLENKSLNTRLHPHSEVIFSSILLVKIYGISKLSSLLDPEQMKLHISSYLSIFLDVVRKCGGDVVKFLGDAFLIIFPFDAGRASNEIKTATVMMSSICALSLMEECGNYCVEVAKEVVNMKLNCGISCGFIHGMFVGDSHRWEYIVTGQPISEARQVTDEAMMDEICLTKSSFEHVQNFFKGRKTSQGNYLLIGKRRLSSFTNPSIGCIKKESTPRRFSFSKKCSNNSTDGDYNSMSSNNENYETPIGTASSRHLPSNRGITYANAPRSDSKESNCSQSSQLNPSKKHINFNILKGNKEEEKDVSIISRKGATLVKDSSSTSLTDSVGSTPTGNRRKKSIISSNRLTTSISGILRGGSYQNRVVPGIDTATVKNPVNNSPHVSTNSPSNRTNQNLHLGHPSDVRLAAESSRKDFLISLLDEDQHVRQVREFLEERYFDFDVKIRSSNVSIASEPPNSSRLPMRKNSQSNDTTLTDTLSLRSSKLCVAKDYKPTEDSLIISMNESSAGLLFTASHSFELRNVTTLVVEVVGLGLASDLSEGVVLEPQRVFSISLSVTKQYQGSVTLFTSNGHGCVFVVSFGLSAVTNSPLSHGHGHGHEDSCRCALEAALSMRESLQSSGFDCRQGIADGSVFCGLIGNADWREFAILGCSVTLATSLMTTCELGEILVSESVYLPTRPAFAYTSMQPVEATGYLQPVAVYRATARAPDSGSPLPRGTTSSDVCFIGRSKEVELLVAALKSCCRVAPSPTTTTTTTSTPTSSPSSQLSCSFIIEGPAGVGKSRLVKEAITSAAGAGASPPCCNNKVLIATASAAHTTTPYHVIRQIMEQILQIKSDKSSLGPMGAGPCKAPNVTHPFETEKNEIEYAFLNWIYKYSVGSAQLNYTSEPPFTSLFDEENQQAYVTTTNNNITSTTPPPHNNNNNNNNIAYANFVNKINDNMNKSDHRKEGSPLDLDLQQENDLQSKLMNVTCIADLTPLLGTVLGTEFKDNSVTAAFSAVEKKVCAELLVLFCIRTNLELSDSTCSTILVENLQWCDWRSLRVLARLSHRWPTGSTFIGTTRPLEDFRKSSNGTTTGAGGAVAVLSTDCSGRQVAVNILLRHSHCLRLLPFDEREVKVLLSKILGSRLLLEHPGILSSLNIARILERSGGLPAHAAMLAAGLKKTLLTGKFSGIQSLLATDDSPLKSQFELLSKPDQLILLIASVIGMCILDTELLFVLNALDLPHSVESLPSTLATLCRTEMLVNGEEEGSYCFLDRLVRERVYQLMLASQREKIHSILGYYYEREQRTGCDRFEDILYHFRLSDDMSKKIEYLTQDMERARAQGKYEDVCRNLAELVEAATGSDCDELVQSCIKVQAVESLHNGNRLDIFKRLTACLPVPSTASLPSTSSYSANRSCSEKYVDDVDDSLLCSVLSFKYLCLKDFRQKIKPSQAKDVTTTSVHMFTSTNYIDYLAEMSYVQYRMGNFIESSNLCLLSLWNCNFLNVLPSTSSHCSLSRTNQKSKSEYSISRYSHLNKKGLILPSLEIPTLTKIITALESITVLYLLRGLADEAVCAVNLLSSTVDSILDHSTSKSEQSSLNSQQYPVRVSSLQSMVAIASSKHEVEAQGHFAATDALVDLVENDIHRAPLSLLLYLASFAFSKSKFQDCCSYLTIVTRQVDGQAVDQSIAHLGIAWCSFLSGNLTAASSSLDKVLSFAAQSAHSPLHIWALELLTLMKTFSRDFEGIEECLRMIRSLQKRDDGTNKDIFGRHDCYNYNATTSAVAAFSMVANQQFERGCVHAMYACKMLSGRKQGLAVSGILLFCATYALLDVIEHRRSEALDPAAATTGVSPTTSSLNFSEPNATRASKSTPRFASVTSTTSAIAATADKLTSGPLIMIPDKLVYETIRSSVDALGKLSLRFPCLKPLLWSLSVRISRLESCGAIRLVELDQKLKNYDFSSFVFAGGYIHLQRSLLCRKFKLSLDFQRSKNSLFISKGYFLKLGGFPEALVRLELADEQRSHKTHPLTGRLFVDRRSNLTGPLTEDKVDDDREEIAVEVGTGYRFGCDLSIRNMSSNEAGDIEEDVEEEEVEEEAVEEEGKGSLGLTNTTRTTISTATIPLLPTSRSFRNIP